MAKKDRLGTHKFCAAWKKAGAKTTVWCDEKRPEVSFVHQFQKISGHTDYDEKLIKSRIADYERELAGARGVSAPPYPKKRLAAAVAFFQAEKKAG